jgi:hypothetical protein
MRLNGLHMVLGFDASPQFCAESLATYDLGLLKRVIFGLKVPLIY